MKGLVILAFLAFSYVSNNTKDKPVKVVLVYKGLKNLNGKYQLWFLDKKNRSYYFNPQRSNTEPYVFFSTGVDGSLKENEKIIGLWFLIGYSVFKEGKIMKKIILSVEGIK